MISIRELDVKACRGILNGPTLRLENGGLLLQGDNGTGKSSFIDAIEQVLSGQCSSLEVGNQNVSWRKHGRHIKATQPVEIEVLLHAGGSETRVALSTDRATLPSDVREYLEAACRQSFLLRRRSMLRYIDSKDPDRYTAIQHFLDLSRYETFEKKLKNLLDKAKTQSEVASSQKKRQQEALRSTLKVPQPLEDEIAAVAAINTVLQAANLELLNTRDDVPERLRLIETELRTLDSLESVDALRRLEDKIAATSTVRVLASAGDDYLQARRVCLEQEKQLHGHFHTEVLKVGRDWIAEDDLQKCPLCEQPIDAAQTRENIEARLAAQMQVLEAREKQSRAQQNWRSRLTAAHEAWRGVCAGWPDAMREEWPQDAQQLFECCDAWLAASATSMEVADIEAALREIDVAVWENVTQMLYEQVRARLGDSSHRERFSRLHRARNALNAFDECWKLRETALTDAAHLEVAVVQLKKLVSLADKGRKNAVQGLLNQIGEQADAYFQQIHPDENIGRPTLRMNERGATSMSLSTGFHGEEGDPRGHYSEGHVDSMGLCLFLAIRRLHFSQQPHLPLLVLDDVLHSVDGNHRFRTAELIFHEFKDHQIIITTHDPLWFENLKKASERHGGKRKWTKRRIASWTLEGGPVWGDHLSDYDWLVSPDGATALPSVRVARAGRLLEQMLQELCDSLTVSVPYSIRGVYTLEPLWNSFYKTAKEKNKGFRAVMGNTLEDTASSLPYRNSVGAHWNEWAQGLTASEATVLVNSVVSLRKATYCDSCGQFIGRIGGISGLWSCRKECLQYRDKV